LKWRIFEYLWNELLGAMVGEMSIIKHNLKLFLVFYQKEVS